MKDLTHIYEKGQEELNDGKEIWKINDIVQAKIPRGYDEIE